MTKGYHVNFLKPTRVAGKIIYPFKRLVQTNSLGGLILLLALLIGLLWANSAWREQYPALWEKTYAGIFLGQFSVKMSLQHWVNDGLMTIFFFWLDLKLNVSY